MSSDDDFSNRDLWADAARQPEPLEKKSGCGKLLLLFGGLAFLGACCVCGGAVYSFVPTIENDPVAAKVALDGIAPGIAVPDDMTPLQRMHFEPFFVVPIELVLINRLF